jgi:hypothetical protein
MISIFKDGDASIWIPVAKGKNGGYARAFLPINGLEELIDTATKPLHRQAGISMPCAMFSNLSLRTSTKSSSSILEGKRKNNIEHAGGTATKQGLRF